DHQGTPREIFSEGGQASWAGRLNTWGQMQFWRYRDGKAENDPNYTECPFRFAGQYEDEESGLYYNRFRYYDRETGQYLSPDPIGLLGGLNPYGYVHCPTGWVDPFGLAGDCCDELLVLATNPRSKTVQEMAEDLANRINRNTVTFSTPTSMGHIDLRGRSHFDKVTQADIPTPHVQVSPINVAPNGNRFPLKKLEAARPATKQDIRTAEKLAERQGLLK
ncbi:RHS repeat-associated core domain-containing protein, partial [Proteus mirabilis]